MPGEKATYTIELRNAGPSTADDAEVTDTLPAALTLESVDAGCRLHAPPASDITCSFGDLGPGAVRTITVIATIDPAATGDLANTAEATSTTPDPDPDDSEDTTTTPLAPRANLSLEKTVTPSPVIAGGEATFTLRTRNAGPSTATGVTVADRLPAGLELVSRDAVAGHLRHGQAARRDAARWARSRLPPTRRWRCACGRSNDIAGTSVKNSGVTRATTPDPDPTDNTDEAELIVSATSDLKIVKTIEPDPPTAGKPIKYLLTVTNAGPSPATDIVVTDQLPAVLTGVTARMTEGDGGCAVAAGNAVSCTLPALDQGGTAVVTIDAGLPLSAAASVLTNTATVAGKEPDPDPVSNTSTVTRMVAPAADISIAKTAPADVAAGGELSYSLLVRNNGPSPASTVTAVDTLPAGVELLSVPAGCTTADRTVTCAVGALAAGEERVLELRVRVPHALGSQDADQHGHRRERGRRSRQRQQQLVGHHEGRPVRRPVDQQDRSRHGGGGRPGDVDGDGAQRRAQRGDRRRRHRHAARGRLGQQRRRLHGIRADADLHGGHARLRRDGADRHLRRAVADVQRRACQHRRREVGRARPRSGR